MIKYFEAFAGIGAFRSAFEKVGGFECVGWCEIDRFAQKAYRTLYDTKGEIFYEDITKIDYGSMPDFDLLVGGPCCQSFSVAGRRLAFEDDRGNLFFNYMGRKQDRPILLVAAHKPVQKLGALEVQPVDGFIQQQQFGTQRKSSNQIGFFQIAGGQLL